MGTLLQQDYRSETIYRSRGPGQGPAWIDCGVLIKNRPEQGYPHRIIPESFILIYILRGKGLYIDGDKRSHPVAAGDLIPHIPGKPHGVVPESDGKWVEFFLMVPAPFFRALSDMGHLPADDGLRHLGVRKEFLVGIEEFMRSMRQAGESDAPKLLQHAHALMNRFYRPTSSDQGTETHRALIELTCEALSGHDADAVDLEQLAERHGLSYERLRKLFRESVGLPPGEYRIRKRVDRARALIAEKGLSNKEVAYELGYPDPFTFSKQFKKYVGMSPSAFRQHL